MVCDLFRAFAVVSFSAVILSSLPVRADLLLHYDFNDASDAAIVGDQSGNGNGRRLRRELLPINWNTLWDRWRGRRAKLELARMLNAPAVLLSWPA